MALAVDDVPIPGEFKVMAWGEHVDYGVAAIDAMPDRNNAAVGILNCFGPQ